MKLEKRDGRVVDFEVSKISRAIEKAMLETEKGLDSALALKIANKVMKECGKLSEELVHIEAIQDCVELELMNSDRKDVAKRYILYREERNKLRNSKVKSKYNILTDDFLAEYKHKSDPFPNELGKFVYYRTYSRPLPQEGRRERWWETVARVVDFNVGLQIKAMQRQGLLITSSILQKLEEEAEEIYDLMYYLKLFPSGRSLWIGGTQTAYSYALANFNCSFMAMDDVKKFSELIFVLMLGRHSCPSL